MKGTKGTSRGGDEGGRRQDRGVTSVAEFIFDHSAGVMTSTLPVISQQSPSSCKAAER